MGCLCSKKQRERPASVQGSVFNILHSSFNRRFTNQTRQSAKPDDIPTKLKQFSQSLVRSLLTSPSQDELKLRGWLRKQGHIIRSWKNRYFVLTANSLQYYEKSKESPPYGENLCGEVYLRGAVIEVKKNVKDTTIVEIAGRKGEKDLKIELSKSIDNSWINALEWTIRRCSKTYIERVLRSNQVAPIEDDVNFDTYKDKKKLECFDWVKNEKKKYSSALRKLCRRRFVPAHVFQFNGRQEIETCEIVLWNTRVETAKVETALEKYVIPDPTMSPRSYGIEYTLHDSVERRGVDSETRILSFADISNISEYSTNFEGTEVASAIGGKVKHLSGKPITKTVTIAGKKTSRSATCTDYSCCQNKIRNRVFSIETIYGLSIDIVCCCMYDHNELFLSLRDIFLYLKLNVPIDECSNLSEELNQKLQTLEYFTAKRKADA